MSRLLLVAHDVVGERMAGPGIRAWEMASALARRGVAVTLAAPGAPSGSPPGSLSGSPPGPPPGAEAFDVVGYDAVGATLRTAAKNADAILLQGLVLANHPFLAGLGVPLIADLYDPFILENLSGRAGGPAGRRARRDEGDRGALTAILETADLFLCASEVQQDFWLGALAAAGRVNAETYDADPTLRRLIEVVPFGIPTEPPLAGPPTFKGRVPGIGPDDIVALWGGGIWNWFDPVTLIRAVDRVSRTHPLRLVFLGTSSPSPHIPQMAAARNARALSDELGLTGRVVFFNEGWVPYLDRGRYLLEADIAVSCHLPAVETRYAFRTRLLDCIWAGLPMVVTGGDVLADVVEANELGMVVPALDEDALVAALLCVVDASQDPAGKAAYADAFARIRPAYTWDAVVAPLARFLEKPSRAADARGSMAAIAPPTPISALPGRAIQVVREEGLLALADEALHYLAWRRRSR